jgi:hypothetical protein
MEGLTSEHLAVVKRLLQSVATAALRMEKTLGVRTSGSRAGRGPRPTGPVLAEMRTASYAS